MTAPLCTALDSLTGCFCPPLIVTLWDTDRESTEKMCLSESTAGADVNLKWILKVFLRFLLPIPSDSFYPSRISKGLPWTLMSEKYWTGALAANFPQSDTGNHF